MSLPQQFGRYELRELIGRGGMGEVYRAFDTVRDRTVALKVLPDYLAGDASFDARFRRESRMAAKLNEPHIIPIHDFGEIDGKLFLDMRLVEGRDLGSVLETRGTLEPEVAVDIIAQTASALDAAHASGLVHRDVKPSNILLTGLSDDPHALPFAYLVDFGIARSAQQEGTALTATTATVGTVAYMSPERIAGKPSDLRTDVYALACVLFETLTGRKPYDGEMFAQMYAHINAAVPQASRERADVPQALDEVITKGMAKDPDDRYPTTGALATAARAALRGANASGATTPLRNQPAPPPSGPLPSGPLPSGPLPSGPLPSGPLPSGPLPSGPLPSGSPPAGPSQPRLQPQIPQQWTPPPPPRTPTAPLARAPGPPPPVRGPNYPPNGPPPGGPSSYGPPASRPDRTRRRLIAALVAVVVLAAAIGIAFAVTRGGGGGHQAARTTAPPTRSTSGPSTSVNSGGANLASVDWSHFSAFSKLLGTKNGDTAHAFNGGTCTVSAPDSSDQKSGVLDEVECTYSGTKAQVDVARFNSADDVRTYLNDEIFHQANRELVWTTGGQPRGLALVSPQTGTGLATITTAICGLPTYLVQVGAPDRTAISTQTLHDTIWNKATFPDTTPAECDSTFTATQSGTSSSAPTGPAKDVAAMGTLLIQNLLQRENSSLDVVQVPTRAGVDIMGVGQTGLVSFWQESNDSLQRVGVSSYPYKLGTLGPPDAVGSGAVLTNMTDATFVLRGVFSGDGSGNAVAYTNGPKGWGAIKGESSGNELLPSGQGVNISGIGLSNDFELVGGRLETIDCSPTLSISQCSGQNRVIKYWTWMTDHFVQTGRDGLSK